ncbi:two-component sensor histidine kinase [Halarcobacter anaerophilus]|uniref:histidine kinase n=2 Tax=Halarcobacter anaerophilus TaxID=877500 RepID=A0A4Q0Y3I3_9BACT|nr:two-component system sensor histidine kinase, putative CusS [Halarcobacter anaerophilus]RXJ64045.1 two-component sensor histidine kinase [Halarcobacter anaerophilus]
MDLTRSERITFSKFLGLYLGSSFILLTIIFLLFYKMESRSQYELITSNMQNVASKVSSAIIYAHMAGLSINTAKMANFIKYDYALFDKEHRKLIGNIKNRIDLSKKLQKIDDSFVLVDSTPRGHLGVYHIVIKENIYHDIITKLTEKLIFYFFLIYSTIAVIGYYLASLFISPIINERKKLNNFIKDTTHELNTPITAILMSTGKDAPLTQKNLQRINLSAKRISEIYKDLVYLFLQDSNNKPHIEELQLDKIIEQQLEYFQSFSQKKRLTINSKLEPTTFKIDKENFSRLFNNLISNAIKYNKIGGFINITLKDSTLIIEDGGIGIKKDRLKDIFNRYYRGTKEQGGFGIGLNIVYHICKTYNIEIEVESQETKGTTFKLKFKD